MTDSVQGLVSYSEATRYTPEKHAETAKWCRANGKPVPQHTLYPRIKGFVATVQNLRLTSHVKAVYDLTLAYSEGEKFMSPPRFFQTLYLPNINRNWQMYVHVQRYDLQSLPETDEKLAEWLESRWIEKGEKLEVLRQKLAKGMSWEDEARLPNGRPHQ